MKSGQLYCKRSGYMLQLQEPDCAASEVRGCMCSRTAQRGTVRCWRTLLPGAQTHTSLMDTI